LRRGQLSGAREHSRSVPANVRFELIMIVILLINLVVLLLLLLLYLLLSRAHTSADASSLRGARDRGTDILPTHRRRRRRTRRRRREKKTNRIHHQLALSALLFSKIAHDYFL